MDFWRRGLQKRNDIKALAYVYIYIMTSSCHLKFKYSWTEGEKWNKCVLCKTIPKTLTATDFFLFKKEKVKQSFIPGQQEFFKGCFFFQRCVV